VVRNGSDWFRLVRNDTSSLCTTIHTGILFETGINGHGQARAGRRGFEGNARGWAGHSFLYSFLSGQAGEP
jgi:hypothetical protein